jgi:NADH:ubiquinone oxidoreductase subunit K
LLQVILVGYLIFFFGIIGLIIRRISIIYILIAIEFMFLGLNIIFLFLGYLLSLVFLQLIVLVLLVLAACEAAILLSLIFIFYKKFLLTDLYLFNLLKY